MLVSRPRLRRAAALGGPLALVLASAPASAQFGRPRALHVEYVNSPAAVAADIDGDGIVDILQGSLGRFDFALYRGIGGDRFDPLEVVIRSGDASGPERRSDDLVTLDIDGDGDVDVARLDVRFLDVFENVGGQLDFRERPAPGMPGPPRLLAVDLDGDGDTDLIQEGPSSLEPLVFLNDGAGDFTATPLSSMPSFAGGAALPSSVLTVADVDGDGNVDVVGVDGANHLAVWRGLGGGGVAFAAPQALGGALSAAVIEIAAADLDGDGDLDLAVTLDRPSATVTLQLLENASPLDFVLRSTLDPVGRRVDLGDIDGDGDLDLVSASYNTPSFPDVLAAVNGGGFDFTNTLTVFTGSSSIGSFELLDATGDGIDDLLVVERIQGTESRVVLVTGDAPLLGQPPLQGPRLSLAQERDLVGPPAIIDWDMDGQPDSIASFRDDAGELDVVIRRGRGGGRLDPPQALDGPPFLISRSVAVDFDADGDQDIVAEVFAPPINAFRLALVRNDGTLRPTIVRSDANYGRFRVADIDGDGRLDTIGSSRTVLTNRIYGARQSATGGWEALETFVTGVRRTDLAQPADMDGDGVLDLVYAAGFPGARSMSWSRGAGGGVFGPPVMIAPGEVVGGPGTVDLNGDGHMDVIWADEAAGEVRLALGGGDGTFGAPQGIFVWQGFIQTFECRQSHAPVGEFMATIGTSGILGSQRNLYVIRWDTALVPRVDINQGLPFTGDAFQGFGDVDADGDADVIYANAEMALWVPNEDVTPVGSDVCGPGVPTSLGRSARLQLIGRAEAPVGGSTGDLTLEVFDVPPQTPVLFVLGGETGFIPGLNGFDGNLCVGLPGLARLTGSGPVDFADLNGIVTRPLDLSALPRGTSLLTVMPGDTWVFQAIFRDLASPGQANLTNAISVVFQ